MSEQILNNQVSLIGKIKSNFTFSHEVYKEGFYMVDLEVQRKSDSVDTIPVLVSERLVNTDEDFIDSVVKISGQFRSYNKHEGNKNKLILYVFAREFEFVDAEEVNMNKNYVYLEGYLCKSPIYRKTPLGREIADLFIAVNRPYGKADYLPCICWGRNAKFASSFTVGTQCAVWGRIQSREYMKRIDEDQLEKRVCYEISINKLEYIDPNSESEEE